MYGSNCRYYLRIWGFPLCSSSPFSLLSSLFVWRTLWNTDLGIQIASIVTQAEPLGSGEMYKYLPKWKSNNWRKSLHLWNERVQEKSFFTKLLPNIRVVSCLSFTFSAAFNGNVLWTTSYISFSWKKELVFLSKDKRQSHLLSFHVLTQKNRLQKEALFEMPLKVWGWENHP